MDVLITMMLLAVVCETFMEGVKTFLPKKVKLIELLSFLVGIGVCISFKFEVISLLANMELPSNVVWIAYVLTGGIVGRGGNVVHTFIDGIQEIVNKQKNFNKGITHGK